LTMPEFIYLIHPYRHGFFDSPTAHETAVMEEHYQYLQKGAEDGTVLLAGPCTDETFGVVVFRASDEAAANAFMFNDPSVKQNIMVAELHPMRVSIKGQ
jgi:uncharacterized protein YciI